MARVIKKIKPGAAGSKRYLFEYEESLVCVRYRYDPDRNERLTTVEIIVDRAPVKQKNPEPTPPPPAPIALIRLDWTDPYPRKKILEAGGSWIMTLKLWKLGYDQVVALGLEDRVVDIWRDDVA